jgi:hypothetical protein
VPQKTNRQQENDAVVSASGDNTESKKEDSSARAPSLLSVLLILIWVEGIIAAYFWVHKPWPNGQPTTPIFVLVDLLLAFSLVALAGGIGRLIFRDRLPFSPIENITLQLALGLGILSLFVFFTGLAGFLGVWQSWFGLVLGVLVFSKPILAWLAEWRPALRNIQEESNLERFSRWFVILLVVLAGLQALAPPLKWDSLAYHLELPQQYVDAGRITYLSDNLFVGFPQLAEMMFTWATALGSGSTAATVGWIVSVIAILGLGGFAERQVGRGYRWLACAILMSGASISRGLSWAYVDLWVLFFGLGTIIVFERYACTKKLMWVGIAAVLAGFAFSAKYSAGMILPIGVVFLGVVWLQSSPTAVSEGSHNTSKKKAFHSSIRFSWMDFWRSFVVPAILFGSITLIIAAPWFMRNTIMTGNPVYPFLFAGLDMDELRLSFYQGEVLDKSILDYLLIPIEATIFGIEGGPKFNTSISPLFLALIPGIVIGWHSLRDEIKKGVGRMAAVALTAWFIWGLGSQFGSALTRTRHYYVIFPALVILTLFGYVSLRNSKVRSINTGWLVSGLIIFVFLIVAIAELLFFAKADPIRVLAGFQTQEEYLTEQLGWFGPAMEAVNSLPEGAKVALFWEPRSYYCEVYCSPDVILDRWWYLMRTAGTAQEAADLLRSQDFTHVLIYDLGVRLIRDKENAFEVGDWEELERFQEAELQVVQHFDDTYTLYAVPPFSDE